MLNKLLLTLLIFFVWYILLVFNSQNIANSIEKILWLDWFNKKIIDIKNYFDTKVTNIPSTEKVISWALDLKNTIVEWATTTKEKIDSVRLTMSGVENTYNDIKDWYNSVKSFIDSNSWKIDEIKTSLNTIKEVTNTITNTWETN